MSAAVLILGGGTMQRPAVEAARHRGLIVHVADGNDACVCRPLVDCFHHVDLRDRDGLLATARTIPSLTGVFTAGTDFSANTAWIAEHLGLPGMPYHAACNATDKGLMRAAFAAARVPIPRHVVWESDGEPFDARVTDSLTYPLVCKPVDNMGARGVKLAGNRGELQEAVAAAHALSRSGRVIIEEQIIGQEYSLDALIERDKIRITGIAERHIYFSPWFVELGHTIPAQITDEQRMELESVFRAAIRALGLTSGVGAAKGDIFLTPDNRGVVGEVAARLSGGYMSGWTYPAASGVALTDAALGLALGERLVTDALTPSRNHVVAERAVISAPGIVEAVNFGDRFDELVETHFVHAHAERSIAPPTNNVEKAVNVIVRAETRPAVEDRARRALDQVLVRLVPALAESDAWLFGDAWRGRYARYRGDDETTALIAALPPIAGSLSEIAATLTTTGCLPVQQVAEIGSLLTAQYPAAAPSFVLDRLQSEGRIELVTRGSCVSGRFWRAFCAAGEQGADYVIRSVPLWRDPA